MPRAAVRTMALALTLLLGEVFRRHETGDRPHAFLASTCGAREDDKGGNANTMCTIKRDHGTRANSEDNGVRIKDTSHNIKYTHARRSLT